MDLNMTSVDSAKAFDTVSRDGLWKIITMFDFSDLAMVRQFIHACTTPER